MPCRAGRVGAHQCLREGEFGARHFLVSTELRSVKALAFQAVALHVTCSEEGIIQQHSSNVDQISPVLLRVLFSLPSVSFQGLPVVSSCSLFPTTSSLLQSGRKECRFGPTLWSYHAFALYSLCI